MGLHEEYQGAWKVASNQGVVFRLNLHIKCHDSASIKEVTISVKGFVANFTMAANNDRLSISSDEETVQYVQEEPLTKRFRKRTQLSSACAAQHCKLCISSACKHTCRTAAVVDSRSKVIQQPVILIAANCKVVVAGQVDHVRWSHVHRVPQGVV